MDKESAAFHLLFVKMTKDVEDIGWPTRQEAAEDGYPKMHRLSAQIIKMIQAVVEELTDVKLEKLFVPPNKRRGLVVNSALEFLSTTASQEMQPHIEALQTYIAKELKK